MYIYIYIYIYLFGAGRERPGAEGLHIRRPEAESLRAAAIILYIIANWVESLENENRSMLVESLENESRRMLKSLENESLRLFEAAACGSPR